MGFFSTAQLTRGSAVKFPHTLFYSQTPTEITPYHVSPRGQESKCHVDVSQRRYRMGKTNLRNMAKTMQKWRADRIYKRPTAPTKWKEVQCVTSLRDQPGMHSREGWVEKCRRGSLKVCYTRRIARTIFSATQRCNIVATLFRTGTTLFQHCNAVLL